MGGEIELAGVYQATSDDCVAACVATLFGLPLAAVPRFAADDWFDPLTDWLAERGFAAVNMRFEGDPPRGLPRGYTLGAVHSDMFPPPYLHCVVCLDGKQVWCPVYGHRSSTKPVVEFTIIYPTDPRLIAAQSYPARPSSRSAP